MSRRRVGRIFAAVLLVLAIAAVAGCGPAPSGANGSGDLVEVNLATQTMTVWRGGGIVLTTHVSTGKSSTPTPPGRYAVYSMQGGWVRTQNGTVYKPLWFRGNYGVHGFGSVPNYPASHGCVRVPVATQDQVFANAYVGMPVWVH
jgi:N-acetylmuramoyl-L-alanine amidase